MGRMLELDVQVRPVGTIPLAEVSGLALGEDRDGQLTVVAIGDRAATIVWASVESGLADLRWLTEDLSGAPGSSITQDDPQLEAVAVDGAGGVLLVQEHPNHATFIHAPTRRVVARFILEVPEGTGMSDLRRSWDDPEGSHSEGAVLLRDGHLLVAKEKDPSALIEFGPAGDAPRGFGPGRWQPLGQPWHTGQGDVTLTALAVWYPDAAFRRACPDISDASVGILGNLVLLSDQGQVVAVVTPRPPGPDPASGQFGADALLRLRGVREKPEGLAILPNGDVLIACDRKKVGENLFVVPYELWRQHWRQDH